MAGNQIMNKKQNTISFFGFLCLFLTCMGIVAYAVYNLVERVPKEEIRMLKANCISNKNNEELVTDINTYMDSVVKLLEQNKRVKSIERDINRLDGGLSFPDDMSALGLSHESFEQLQEKVLNLKEEQEDLNEDLQDLKDDLKDLKEKKQEVEQELSSCKSDLQTLGS